MIHSASTPLRSSWLVRLQHGTGVRCGWDIGGQAKLRLPARSANRMDDPRQAQRSRQQSSFNGSAEPLPCVRNPIVHRDRGPQTVATARSARLMMANRDRLLRLLAFDPRTKSDSIEPAECALGLTSARSVPQVRISVRTLLPELVGCRFRRGARADTAPAPPAAGDARSVATGGTAAPSHPRVAQGQPGRTD